MSNRRQGTDVSPHFFKRDEDGSVRLRIRFTKEEADIIEEAAADTPLVHYIQKVLMDRARAHAEAARKERQQRLRQEQEPEMGKEETDHGR